MIFGPPSKSKRMRVRRLDIIINRVESLTHSFIDGFVGGTKKVYGMVSHRVIELINVCSN